MAHNFMPEDRAITMHLSKLEPTGDIEVFSGFVKGLSETREAAGRDPSTGKKITGRDHASWIGVIGYMALLDQIGSCFKPKYSATVNGNSICRALNYFSTLSSQEIDAIYALRCAFAHDFSLYNINMEKPGLTHCFKVFGSSLDPLIELPKRPWNGDYQNKQPECQTAINLELLGELVEQICHKLFALAKANDLEVALSNGSDELLQRYSFYRKRKQG